MIPLNNLSSRTKYEKNDFLNLTSPLKYALENYVKPRGRPQTTWLSTMKKQLEDHNLTWENACNIASDRIEWKKYK